MAQESLERNDGTGCQQPDRPILCTNKCGFFGSKTTRNLCSKCYRDTVILHVAQNVSEKSRLTLQAEVQIEKCEEVNDSSTGSVVSSSSTNQQDMQQRQSQQPNRCLSCKKRVGLTGFKCRCGHVFCALHRHFDKHACTFDYKGAGRDAIAEANPVVKASKVDKI